MGGSRGTGGVEEVGGVGGDRQGRWGRGGQREGRGKGDRGTRRPGGRSGVRVEGQRKMGTGRVGERAKGRVSIITKVR